MSTSPPVSPPSAREQAQSPGARETASALAKDVRRPAPVVLDAHSVEAVARRVAEIMRDEGNARAENGLVDAATLAAELGVKRSWVYEHREQLGAVKLGTGSKPRLRFDVQTVRKALARRNSGWPASLDQGLSDSAGSPARRQRYVSGRSSKPGSVLAVRPRRAA